MQSPIEPPCPGCAARDAEIAARKAEPLALRERLAASKKTSADSSKPPSSDIVAPPKPAPPPGQDKRRIGGQPGHRAHFRAPFDDLEVDAVVPHEIAACPGCGGGLRPSGAAAELFPQVEIVLPKLHVTEHVFPEFWCDGCRKACRAPRPPEVERGGMAGPTLITLVAFMKGCCHASFSTVRLFLRDVCGLTVARSTLDKILKRATAALDGPYDELLKLLPEQGILNVDAAWFTASEGGCSVPPYGLHLPERGSMRRSTGPPVSSK